MLEHIIGSKSCEQVFIFLIVRQEGYATEIADFFNARLFAIQRQLERLESFDVLVSNRVGRTRLFRFNENYLLLNELKALLQAALIYYPSEIKGDLVLNRR